MEFPRMAKELFDGIMNSPFVIGFGGAIAGVLTTGKLSIWRRISMTIIGALCSGYLSPFIQYMFGVENVSAKNFIAFVVGMLGMSLTGGIMKLGEELRKDPQAFINRFRKWRK